MRWTKFVVQNFKGIKESTIELDSNGNNIYTIVGLNESGKTTLLEAIEFFGRNLSAKEDNPTEKSNQDLSDIIPLPKLGNFNDTIILKGFFIIEADEKQEIIKKLGIHDFNNSEGNAYSITKQYTYEASKFKESNNYWALEVHTKSKKGKTKKVSADDELWQETVKEISKKLPAISYFPTFAFQIPEKINLQQDTITNEKDKKINQYFLTIMQDILDAANPGSNLTQHILDRMLETGTDKAVSIKSMEQLVYKMGIRLNTDILTEWNRIFGKPISDKITIKSDIATKSLYFELEGKESISLIQNRSLGFRWFFCFLLFTKFRGKRIDNTKVLFLFDEPASYLHSTAQKRVLDSFEKITKDGCYIIYSTHSHYMINPKWLEHTYIVANEALHIDETEKQTEDDFDSARDISIKIWKYKHFVSNNPAKTTYYQPILDVLDYKPTDLEFSDNIHLLEGKTDFYVIKYFIDVIFKNDKKFQLFKKIKIAPSFGASGMETLISLYLGWGYNFKIILDADIKKCAGKESQKKYIEEYGLKKDQVLCLDDIHEDWKNCSIEGLLDNDDKLKLQKSEFPDTGHYDKKIFHTALLIKLSKQEEFDFSEKTVSNFKKLISYMASSQEPLTTHCAENKCESLPL